MPAARYESHYSHVLGIKTLHRITTEIKTETKNNL